MSEAEERDPGAEPSAEEQEVYRRLEEQLAKLRVEDLLVQSVVSILNLAGRRIAKEDERDLDQARTGIEAVRVLLPFLPEDSAAAVREGLSQVQVLYARYARETPPEPGSEEEPSAEAKPPREAPPKKPSGLWVPPGAA